MEIMRSTWSSWKTSRLGSQVTLRNGSAFSADNWKSSGLPIVRIQNLKDTRAPFNFYDGALDSKVVLQNGDLLFSWSGSKGTSFGPHIWCGAKAVLNQHIFRVDLRTDANVTKQFLYFALLHQTAGIESHAYGLAALVHVRKGDLENTTIPVPSLNEQRQIAHVLSAFQQAIERQKRLITLAAELKKALMHKLFTNGTRGEPLKQTDIGAVPQSWTVTELQEVAEPPQYGFTASAQPAGNAQILRITDIQNAGVNWSSVPYCECTLEDLAQHRLRTGDLVFARIGATTGKNFLVVDPPDSAVFASYLIRVRPRETLVPGFAAYFCQTAAYWRQIAASKGNNLKGGFNSSLLRRLLIALPADPTEQHLIVEVLAALDRKIDVARRTSAVLNAGFRTLLHQLMTAEIRVHDLDLCAFEETEQEPVGVS